jgi:hypothetical protein
VSKLPDKKVTVRELALLPFEFAKHLKKRAVLYSGRKARLLVIDKPGQDHRDYASELLAEHNGLFLSHAKRPSGYRDRERRAMKFDTKGE